MALPIARQAAHEKNEAVGQIVFIMLCLSICASLLLPGRLLVLVGINYLTADAATLEKVHPSTYLVFITFFLWLVQSVFDKKRSIEISSIKFTIYYFGSAVFVIFYSAAMLEGQSANIVDSLFCPAFYVAMLHFTTKRQRNIILLIVLAFVAVNTVIILYEFASGSPFLPPVFSDQTEYGTLANADYEGRTSGLYGHPLSAGTMTLIFLVCCFETINQLRWRIVTLLLVGGAIATFPTFGSRWALALFALYCIYIGGRFLLNVAMTRRISQQSIVIVFGVLVAIIPLGVVADQFGVFDKLIERGESDSGSAESRMIAWELFTSADNSDMVFGDTRGILPHKLVIYKSTAGVETFWFGFIMRYGLICAAVYFPGLFALMYQIRRDGGKAGLMIAIFFLALISGSLSILGKTQLFSQVVIFAYALMPYLRDIRGGVVARVIKRVSAQRPVVMDTTRQGGTRWSDGLVGK